MEDTTTKGCSEVWDRLALLFISRPREGWEPEFEEITRREIERLRLPKLKREHKHE